MTQKGDVSEYLLTRSKLKPKIPDPKPMLRTGSFEPNECKSHAGIVWAHPWAHNTSCKKLKSLFHILFSQNHSSLDVRRVLAVHQRFRFLSTRFFFFLHLFPPWPRPVSRWTPRQRTNFGRTEIVYCVAFKETPTVSSIHLRVLGTLGHLHPKIRDRRSTHPFEHHPGTNFIGPSATSQPNMQYY